MANVVRRAQAGDIVAWAEIVREYHPRLVHIIKRLVQDDNATDDVIQEAFVRAYMNIEGFNFRYQFSTWIFAIAINLARDLLRKRKSQREEPLEYYEQDLLAATADDPLVNFDAKRLNEFLTQGIQSLPENLRAAFLMVHHEEKTYAEASEILGIPLTTVKSRAHQARAKLRAYLHRQCPHLLGHYGYRPMSASA